MAIRNLSTEGLFHVRIVAARFARTHRSRIHGGRGVGLRVQYAAADVHAARTITDVHAGGYVHAARATANAYARGYVYTARAIADAYPRGYVYAASTTGYIHATSTTADAYSGGYVYAAATTADIHTRGYVYAAATTADIYAGSNGNAYAAAYCYSNTLRRYARKARTVRHFHATGEWMGDDGGRDESRCKGRGTCTLRTQ